MLAGLILLCFSLHLCCPSLDTRDLRSLVFVRFVFVENVNLPRVSRVCCFQVECARQISEYDPNLGGTCLPTVPPADANVRDERERACPASSTFRTIVPAAAVCVTMSFSNPIIIFHKVFFPSTIGTPPSRQSFRNTTHTRPRFCRSVYPLTAQDDDSNSRFQRPLYCGLSAPPIVAVDRLCPSIDSATSTCSPFNPAHFQQAFLVLTFCGKDKQESSHLLHVRVHVYNCRRRRECAVDVDIVQRFLEPCHFGHSTGCGAAKARPIGTYVLLHPL